MEIRIRSTGQVVQESEFRALFPNTGFPSPLTTEIINDFGGDAVLEGPQASPTRYQVGFRDGVQEMEGQWYTKYSVADMDVDAKASTDAAQAQAIRAMRDQKLSASDWTQLADAPVDKAAWAAYRQDLRNVPAQAGFPWDVIWPEAPK
jgi:hypothetical protein